MGKMALKTTNGCRDIKDDVLSKLRRIARSRSIESSEQGIEALKATKYWKADEHRCLNEYIERTWLCIKEVKTLLRWLLKMLLLFNIHI